MDQTTHELRLADWQTIVNNCLARPAGQSKKQWLEEHGVPAKPYYYWQRKIRQLVYSRQQQSEIHAEEPEAYEFAEIPFPSAEAVREETIPAAIIRKGNDFIELNNSVNDHLLDKILETISHA